LFAGASTGVFWGVPFLAPQVLKGYSSFEIAFGRFFFFGVMGLFFFPRLIRMVRSLSRLELIQVFFLSAMGFWFYSSLLFWSIQETDGVISSLVLGLLPITIPLFTPGRKSGGFLFYGGLILIAAGLGTLLVYPHWNSIESLKPKSGLGVLGLFTCLLLWTAFAIANSKFLIKRPWISGRDFSSLMGLISMICLLPLFCFFKTDGGWSVRPDLGIYLLISAVLGLGSSWFANWLWNFAAQRIPSEVSGQLLVFETLFGLIYTFLFECRFPHGFEIIAMALSMGGVGLAIFAQMAKLK
jgi:drug/metabolite transporter (DMT)-like permease